MEGVQQQQCLANAYGYKCNICMERGLLQQVLIYPSVYALKRHIFGTHLHEKNFTLKCGISGCPVQFLNRRSLSDHVSKHHPGHVWIPFVEHGYNKDTCRPTFQPLHQNTEGAVPTQSPEVVNTVHMCESPVLTGPAKIPSGKEITTPFVRSTYPKHTCEDTDVHAFLEMWSTSNAEHQANVALSIAELKCNYALSQTALEAVQHWAEGMLSSVVTVLHGGVKLATSGTSHGIDVPTLENVFELGEGLANPFQGLGSERMLTRTLKDNLGMVEPETVVLPEAMQEGVGGKTEVHTMQYVPILDVSKLLFNDKKFRTQLQKRRPHSTGKMTDFMDGNYWKNHPLFQKNPQALQIQLYYDGFEVVNPLGSKTQKHNIGAVYFSILNLDPVYRSTLKSICLTALVREKDIKHPDIGWKVILQRLNADLKKLEEGFLFEIGGEEVVIQGTIAQLSLDNKAALILSLGYMMHFMEIIHAYQDTATVPLWIYRKRCVHCGQCQLRTRETFDEDQRELDRTGKQRHGVVSQCFLESHFFHRGDAFAADIHHDVLEGLIPGMLKPVLQVLIMKKKFFTIHMLNDRVMNFNFNAQDLKNRPSVITEGKLKEDSRSLKQYAAQYWCLLRKLPLLVGELVPDDEHWNLLLLLLDVVDLIMSPKVDDQTLSYMEMQLVLLFTEFQRLFPLIRLTPKMHYTLHYPRLMREVGPLIRHWVMRYEAKHHYFKRAAVISGNYINVAKTLAMRHQMLQVVHVKTGGLLRRDVVLKSGYPVKVNDLPCARNITEILNTNTATVCEKVIIFGTVFKCGNAVLTNIDSGGFFSIGEIKTIVVNTAKEVCFVVEMFDVIEYDAHFHSWKIEKCQQPEMKAVLYEALPEYHPVGVHWSFGSNSELYASFRYHISW